MKKLALIAACVVLAGVAVKAEAPPVFSVNGVGYETFTIGGDKSALIRIDFEKIGGGPWTVYDLFGTNYPQAISAYYWTSIGWQSENYDSVFKTWDPGSTPFHRGDCLFLRLRGSASVTNEITIRGEIPGANNGATNTVINVAAGLNTLGYAYPSPVAITNTTLAAVAGSSPMQLFYWTAIGWQSVNYDSTFHTWDPSDFVIQPGQGFMIRKFGAGTVPWTETKQYTWP